MAETEHFDFHDFWILGIVGTHMRGFGYTKLLNYFNKSKKLQETPGNFGNSEMLEARNIASFELWKMENVILCSFDI